MARFTVLHMYVTESIFFSTQIPVLLKDLHWLHTLILEDAVPCHLYLLTFYKAALLIQLFSWTDPLD